MSRPGIQVLSIIVALLALVPAQPTTVSADDTAPSAQQRYDEARRLPSRALFLTERVDAPDPECPRVEDHRRRMDA